MSVEILPTSPSEQETLARFLVSVFHSDDDAPFVKPELLRWKYFEPRPGWSAPRSFVLKQEEGIIAHGGICPVTFLTPRGEVTAIHLIDWGASPSFPGAGVLLLKQLATSVDTMLAIGGSRQTQQVLPKIGFNHSGHVEVYARVIRPWTQLKTYPSRNWKTPLRLIRNTAWSLSPLVSPSGDWSAQKINSFEESTSAILTTRPLRVFTPCKRSPEMLNYMLRCPGAVFSAFLLLQKHKAKGYFMLSRVGGQSRIADILLASDVLEDWQAAYSLAAQTAAEDPRVCELMGVASTSLARSALVSNGFRLRVCDPIFLHDPRGLLSRALPLNLNLLDSDGSYLHDPDEPFLT